MKRRLGKILCTVVASCVLLTQPCADVLAEDSEVVSEEIDDELTEEERALEAEKKAVYETPADTNSLQNWPEGPNIQATAGCVIDMESGAFLYSKNMDDKFYPASITKLLTVLLALENAELTDTVTVSEDSLSFLEYGDAYIGMKPGEEISMEDALYAILLASANEVSYAVAETVGTNNLGGDYSTFIKKMNERAKELGCTSSSWINPNGLHNEEHYTSAHDMALIAAEVYKHEEFRTIMEEYEHRIGFTNLTKEERVFQQNHKMLWDGNQYYWELATGGKTGYTDQARTTLVTMAEDEDLKLACVVLKDYGPVAYDDTRAMMEYVFHNFKKVSLAEQELSDQIESLVDEEAYVLLPEGVDFAEVECEIKEEENGDSKNGSAIFTYEGQVIGIASVMLSDTFFKVDETVAGDSLSKQESKDSISKTTKIIEKIFVGIMLIVGIIAVIVVIICIRNYCILKARKKRRREHKGCGRH